MGAEKLTLRYIASDARHGLFADLRKILEWCWLASERPGVRIELDYRKYDADRADVPGFVEHLHLERPALVSSVDDRTVADRFFCGFDPLRTLLGIELPTQEADGPRIEIHNERTCDRPDVLALAGLDRAHPLWNELQNDPEAFAATRQRERVRAACHDQLERHVRLSERLQRRIDAAANDLPSSGPTVGVHVRFSEHYSGLRPGKAYYVDVIDALERWLNGVGGLAGSTTTIYLATQLVGVVDEAQRRLGDAVRFLDMPRCAGNDDFHFVDNSVQAQLEDAIVDCWLLSRCDLLLGGVSNLAFMAMIINPKMPFHFLDLFAGRRGG